MDFQGKKNTAQLSEKEKPNKIAEKGNSEFIEHMYTPSKPSKENDIQQ